MAFINTLYNLWPNGDEKVPGLRDGIANSAKAVFAKYGIDSPLLVAHVMAQISHECGAGHEVVENLNYRAEQLLRQWSSHFTPAQAAAMAHHPQQIANQAYNGRMGNRVGSDDGWNFRGRGACQTTGRDGYVALMKLLAKNGLNLDLMASPDLVNDPRYFLECGVAEFIACGCLPYAKRDDLLQVSAVLNVGHTVKNSSSVIGYPLRQHWLAVWKPALGSGPVNFAPPNAKPPRDGIAPEQRKS
jgi:putative chitinase